METQRFALFVLISLSAFSISKGSLPLTSLMRCRAEGGHCLPECGSSFFDDTGDCLRNRRCCVPKEEFAGGLPLTSLMRCRGNGGYCLPNECGSSFFEDIGDCSNNHRCCVPMEGIAAI